MDPREEVVLFMVSMCVGFCVYHIFKFKTLKETKRVVPYNRVRNHVFTNTTHSMFTYVSIEDNSQLKYKNEVCPSCHTRRKIENDGLLHCYCYGSPNADVPVPIVPEKVRLIEETISRRAIRLDD